jgi:HSP20 family molecular chaperone IbpA
MKDIASKIHNKQKINIVFDEAADIRMQSRMTEEFINWQPLYDLFVMAEEVVVIIEIAGIDTKDFYIYVDRFSMMIDGVRRSPDILNREYCIFHNLEIPYGRFNRRIDFPVPIEPKRHHYTIENGVLTLKFPAVKEKVIPIEDE